MACWSGFIKNTYIALCKTLKTNKSRLIKIYVKIKNNLILAARRSLLKKYSKA